MSRHLDPSTTTQMAQIMVQYGRPSRLLERNLYGRPWAGLQWETQFENFLLTILLGESFQLRMLIRTPWKRIILICVFGWHQIGWQETQSWSDVESTQQRSRFGRTNIFLGSWKLGLHSTKMRNKQRYCGQLQNHVRIANFREEIREITISSKSAYLFVVLWHGRSCQEMCGTILWFGKQDDSKTLQSINSMPWRPSLQRRRRIEIRGRIVKSVLSNCSKMLVLGTFWKTRYFIVREQTCTINY